MCETTTPKVGQCVSQSEHTGVVTEEGREGGGWCMLLWECTGQWLHVVTEEMLAGLLQQLTSATEPYTGTVFILKTFILHAVHGLS